jgi:hypothetical protein
MKLYHVASRGNARQDIYASYAGRQYFLEFLAKTCGRYQWLCHSCCLVSNHYHLLIETQNLSMMKKCILMRVSYVILMLVTVSLFELSLSVLTDAGKIEVVVDWFVCILQLAGKN